MIAAVCQTRYILCSRCELVLTFEAVYFKRIFDCSFLSSGILFAGKSNIQDITLAEHMDSYADDILKTKLISL
jgi:hypothetical protein